TDPATIVHQGITDAAKANAIGGGTFTLQPDGSGFHYIAADGAWRATATTAALDFNVKSNGETVQIQAPSVSLAADGGAAGVEWTLSTAKVAFRNQARGMSGKNAFIKLTGQPDNLAGEIRVSTFTAGAGLPTLTLNGDGTIKGNKLAAQLNAITGAGGGVNLGKVKVAGNLAKQSYQVDLDLGPINFVVGGLQPAHLFPAAKAYIQDFSGTVRLAGPITWAKGKAKSELKLGLEKLSGTAGPVQFINMNGVIVIDEPWPVSTKPDQEIAIEQILAGLPMSNALVRFELAAPVMHITEGRLDMAGGRASIAPTDINMTAAGQRMTLKIDQLSVSELFKVAGVAGLSGEGKISGQAPITLFPNGIIVDQAKFAAEAPGVLRYDTAQAPAALSSAGDSVGLALQALSDFHYKELVVTLDRRLTGDTDLGLHISGSNPSFYNGYPVEFNLTLSGKLDEVLRKGLAGYRLPSTIEEQLKELQ
ncbi:MAG TPA: YdbH domain-containing protein, partial [Alphaproteobacteria bacterium]|nr:YdbH domain-containing protein [Alphaproteobacteria bacterium]